MPLRLSEEYVGKIDKDKWEKDFNIDNMKSHTAEIVIKYILYKIMWYKMREYDNCIL
jgi:hypothetical protein